jgi:hypothetical protein
MLDAYFTSAQHMFKFARWGVGEEPPGVEGVAPIADGQVTQTATSK